MEISPGGSRMAFLFALSLEFLGAAVKLHCASAGVCSVHPAHIDFVGVRCASHLSNTHSLD